MKLYLYLLLTATAPATAQAVCYLNFVATGYGTTAAAAEKGAELDAEKTCEISSNDMYGWVSRKTDFTYQQIQPRKIRAVARYQCCMQW